MITREFCAVSKPGNNTKAKATIVSLIFILEAGLQEKEHYVLPLSILWEVLKLICIPCGSGWGSPVHMINPPFTHR